MRYLLIAILALTMVPLQGQYENLQKAFSTSYILESQGKYSAAIDTLRTVYHSDHYPSQLRMGWLNYLAGEYPLAVSYYQKAALLMPYAVEPQLGIAYPLWAMGQYAKAEEQLATALQKHPGCTQAKYRLALMAYELQQYDKAQKWLEDVVNLYPFDGPSITLYGWIYFQKSQMDKAKLLFQKALLYDPTSASAQQGLSLIQ